MSYRRLRSGSVIFKVDSDYINPYMLQLKPYVHYIPIKRDLSDLYENTKLILSSDPKHVKLLESIRTNAAEVAKKFTYDEEVQRVFQELYRLWI